MALEAVIAEVRLMHYTSEQSRKRHRYQREEASVERVRKDLESCDREQWLQDTLETEETLG